MKKHTSRKLRTCASLSPPTLRDRHAPRFLYENGIQPAIATEEKGGGEGLRKMEQGEDQRENSMKGKEAKETVRKRRKISEDEN